MKTMGRNPRPGISVVVGACMLASSAAAIGNEDAQPANPDTGSDARRSRSFTLDNDALASDKYDQNYSFGLSFTLRGEEVAGQLTSLQHSLDWLDRIISLDRQTPVSPNSAQFEYGVYAFTPNDLETKKALPDKRPYANLVYIASSHQRYQPAGDVSWHSTLTLGILGLDVAEDLQKGWHTLGDSADPKGWNHQISDGGEPTARYSLARQHLLYRSGSKLEIKTTILGSVGYLTEASWSMSLRAGSIYTPWTSFNPELTSYGEKVTPTDLGRPSEHYFWTGFALKARAYNAFLQGQFRDSDVTFDSDQLNPGIAEAWAGYTYVFESGYSLSYSVRGQTSDFKHEDNNGNYFWGSLAITKYFY